MGLWDHYQWYKENVDASAEHMKAGFGFDPSVCEGCPYRQTDVMGKPCEFCGCPTVKGMMLDITGKPPADCVRLDLHRDQ